MIIRKLKKKKFEVTVSNGHSPQIRQNGELLVRMCQGESQKVSKSPLANVSECIESGLSRVANLANLANF
jgi:hypothetical protein